MYVWTQKQNQMPIRPGFGQVPPKPTAALAVALASKYGVQFNSSLGQSCAVGHAMSGYDRPSEPTKYDQGVAAAKQCAFIRDWTLDELRAVESACNIYCRLNLLPSATMMPNISRLAAWPVPLAGSPTWTSCDTSKLAETKCGVCTAVDMGSDPTCSTGTAQIMLFDRCMSATRTSKEKTATVIHELAHALLAVRFFQKFSEWERHPELTCGRSISYFKGTSDPRWVDEDIADSVACFLNTPGKLRKISKDRYEFLKDELRFSKSCG